MRCSIKLIVGSLFMVMIRLKLIFYKKIILQSALLSEFHDVHKYQLITFKRIIPGKVFLSLKTKTDGSQLVVCKLTFHRTCPLALFVCKCFLVLLINLDGKTHDFSIFHKYILFTTPNSYENRSLSRKQNKMQINVFSLH